MPSSQSTSNRLTRWISNRSAAKAATTEYWLPMMQYRYFITKVRRASVLNFSRYENSEQRPSAAYNLTTESTKRPWATFKKSLWQIKPWFSSKRTKFWCRKQYQNIILYSHFQSFTCHARKLKSTNPTTALSEKTHSELRSCFELFVWRFESEKLQFRPLLPRKIAVLSDWRSGKKMKIFHLKEHFKQFKTASKTYWILINL